MAIGASTEYIKRASDLARQANTPAIHRAERRSVTDAPPKPPTDVATISKGFKPQPLEFNPEPPPFDGSQLPIEQKGSNLELAFFLGIGLNGLQTAAKAVRQENQVLGGTTSD